MIILGRFHILTRLRIDNPAFPQYVIYLGPKIIGRQFSIPTLSDCEWLERQDVMERLVYAQDSVRLTEHSIQKTGCHRRYKFPKLEEEPT